MGIPGKRNLSNHCAVTSVLGSESHSLGCILQWVLPPGELAASSPRLPPPACELSRNSVSSETLVHPALSQLPGFGEFEQGQSIVTNNRTPGPRRWKENSATEHKKGNEEWTRPALWALQFTRFEILLFLLSRRNIKALDCSIKRQKPNNPPCRSPALSTLRSLSY